MGTALATSADAPHLGVVYKLVEIGTGEQRRYTAKLATDKETLPGAKQVFRYPGRDVLACTWECLSCPDDAEPRPSREPP